MVIVLYHANLDTFKTEENVKNARTLITVKLLQIYVKSVHLEYIQRTLFNLSKKKIYLAKIFLNLLIASPYPLC